MTVNALVDYALTRDQTLRLGYSQYTQQTSNLGVGIFDLPERAFSYDQHNYTLRALEAGPIGRKTFINTRLSVIWSDFGYHSANEAPTIEVQEIGRAHV